MTEFGEKVKDIGKNAANLVADATNESLKLGIKATKTVGVVGNAGLDATGKIAASGFETAASAIGHVGNAAVAVSNTGASILSIVRDVTVRTEEISKNAALRQQDVEKLKNSELKKQVDVGIVNNTEETQKNILTIKTNAENAKLQIESEAEIEKLKLISEAEQQKREIEAKDEQNKINQQMGHQIQKDELETNTQNYKESLAYGFKSDKLPYTAGSQKISDILDMFKKTKKIQYFGYYIIIGVLNKETLDFFELHPEDLSVKQLNDIKRKPNTLIYKDNDGNEVRVVMRQKFTKSLFSLSYKIETTLDVYDVTTNELKITGIPVFQKKSYFLDAVSRGGKSRRPNKNKNKKNTNSKKKRQTKTIKK